MKQKAYSGSVLVGLFFVGGCGPAGETESFSEVRSSAEAPKSIVSVEGLDGPEGVRYDPELDLYFVSNFAGENKGDANGFVSKVSTDGEILSLKFMVGSNRWPMHGPRGMFITADGLWVVDADGVHLFNRETGEQLDFVDLTPFEPGFPNDVVQGRDGALYVTDTGKSVLYRIEARRAKIATETAMKPNGITINPATGGLLLAPWEGDPEVAEWDPASGAFSSAGALNGGGNFDGIEVVDGKFVLASQADTSLHVVADGVDRRAIELPGRPADIGIDTRRRRVAVPYVSLDRVDIISLEEVL